MERCARNPVVSKTLERDYEGSREFQPCMKQPSNQDIRGMDGKAIQTDQYQDHSANRLVDEDEAGDKT